MANRFDLFVTKMIMPMAMTAIVVAGVANTLVTVASLAT